MNRIHDQNACTVYEAAFNSLTLTLNSQITEVLEEYCKETPCYRHNHLLARIVKSIST